MQTRKFQEGDIAYLVESNRFIREGRIETCSGGLYLYHFIEGGAIRVKKHRLFASESEVQAYLDRFKAQKKKEHACRKAFWME